MISLFRVSVLIAIAKMMMMALLWFGYLMFICLKGDLDKVEDNDDFRFLGLWLLLFLCFCWFFCCC